MAFRVEMVNADCYLFEQNMYFNEVYVIYSTPRTIRRNASTTFRNFQKLMNQQEIKTFRNFQKLMNQQETNESKEITFTIIWSIPSKKNRHIIKKNRKTGRSYIGSDDEYHIWEVRHSNELSYEMKHLGNFQWYENLHIDYLFKLAPNKDGTPCRKRWDISNKIESINDMMVKSGLIDDDCHTVLRSMTQLVIDDNSITENEVVITIIEITQNTS